MKKATLAIRVPIDVPSGTRVRWAFPKYGTDCDRETAAKHLSRRKTYTVAHTVIHDWSTELFLREFPGVSFNHGLFGYARTATD